MYDYLAKIILLGPSGSGKYVYYRAGIPAGVEDDGLTLANRSCLTGHACCTDSSRTSGGY